MTQAAALPALLSRTLAALSVHPPVAVALSGGPDSLALLDLAQRWAPGGVIALHLDHGLRPESAAEAQMLRQKVTAMGIPMRVLRWAPNNDAAPAAAMQARARAARLSLLGEACTAEGLATLLMAHHRDDQRETVWMRRQRADHGPGLAGMPAARPLAPGVQLVRPLLGVDKATLLAWCAGQGLRPLTDPSNADPRFERVRVRRTLGTWSSEALAALDAEIAAAATARAAMEAQRAWDMPAIVHPDPWGGAVIDAADLYALPADRAAAVLAQTLTYAAQQAPPLAPARGAAILERVDQLADGRQLTGGGCILHRRGSWLFVWQDLRRTAPSATLPTGAHWDRRWRITAGPLTVHATSPRTLRDYQLQQWPATLPRPPAARLSAAPCAEQSQQMRRLSDGQAGWIVPPCWEMRLQPQQPLCPAAFVPLPVCGLLAPDAAASM